MCNYFDFPDVTFNVLFVIVKSGLLQIRERREGETVQVLEMWILVNFMWGLLFLQ